MGGKFVDAGSDFKKRGAMSMSIKMEYELARLQSISLSLFEIFSYI